MALFKYETINQSAKKNHGLLEAENISEAKQKLIRQSLFITSIKPIAPSNKSLISREEKLNLTKELSRLLKAGIPLYESLQALEEKYRGQSGQMLLLDLCEQVRSGHPLSLALQKHFTTFDPLYISLIETAEKTGRLEEALDDLADLMTKQQILRTQLTQAILYPSLLLGFCFFVFGLLIFYVVPSLQELFEGRTLHPFTEFVFSLSRFVCKSKFILLIGFSLVAAALGFLSFSTYWKKKIGKALILMPFISSMYLKIGFIRFFRSASTLLAGSVPIISSISQAKTTVDHPKLKKLIEEAEEKLRQGQSIHTCFINPNLIPPLIPRLLSIAEKGGNLPKMMKQIADIYEEELNRFLSQFSTLIQPILLIILGLIVGFILLSVLLPLTDVSSFATN